MLDSYALIRALRTLLSEPQEPFSVRGLAKKAKLSPSSAKACLDSMNAQGMLKFGRVGRSYQYKADLSQPLARQWKVLFALEDLQKLRVVEEIFSKSRGVASIILYGSLAQGTGDLKSDVDVLVIASEKKRMAFPAIEARLGREVNVLVQTPFEWKEKAKQDKVFYDRVIHDCIVLYGSKPVVL